MTRTVTSASVSVYDRQEGERQSPLEGSRERAGADDPAARDGARATAQRSAKA